MSHRARRLAFWVAGPVLAALLLWGAAGLPGFGHYPGPYGDVLLKTTVAERHVTDVVTSVMYDQRGLDTLGEEFILFAAVAGLVLLLREHRESEEGPEPPRRDTPPPKRKHEAVILMALLAAPLLLFFGIYVTLQAHITVGGGFQGGIVVAAAWLLVYLADERRLFSRISPRHRVELAEALGAAGYAAVGLGGLLAGTAFLHNFLPLGQAGQWLSGGTTPLINSLVGIEVSAGFILMVLEFLYEAQQAEGEG